MVVVDGRWGIGPSGQQHLEHTKAARLPELITGYTDRQDDPEEILERPGRLLRLYGEQSGGPLRDLLREQLARLVPGGWIRPDEL